MEKCYKGTVWTLPDDYLSYETFVVALMNLEFQSSPGWPYLFQKPTIGEWLGYDGFVFDEYQVNSLWCDVQAVIRGEYEPEFRVFIKREPHSLRKAMEGRWRLIIASPLCVQVVWQMLFKYQNDLEINMAYDIPSQQGMILCGGGWEMYLSSWKARGYNTGLDKSAWDWTAPYWAISLDLEFRRRMARGRKVVEWYGLAKKMYDDMFVSPVLRLSNGKRFRQLYPGVMKSGCVNTISTNSHMQVMIHFLACWDQNVSPFPVCVACGDDTLQMLEQAGDVDSYRKYGALVKSASDGIEFVGHDFCKGKPEPIYLGKHFEKFKHVSDEIMPQYLDSMCRLYAHSDNFIIWEELARRMGVLDQCLSREAYQFWYDHETD